MISIFKRFWREIIIAILAVISCFALSRKPETKEVIKTEYVDRVVEKVVTVEKEVVKDKKKRTTIQKPDGTKVVTETEESTKTNENKEKTIVEREEKEIQTETKIQTNHSYNLGIGVKLYPETEYSAGLYMRLGGLPLFIGPSIHVRTSESIQIGLGLGIQIEI